MAENKFTDMSPEEVAFADIIGDLVEQWGFKRHLGRIWSLLYLRKEPLNPSQIQEHLSLSAGAVSTALTELQTWGVVKRLRIAADRNFYYESESHIWKSISNVLRAREMRILEEAIAGLKVLEGTLHKENGSDIASFQAKRLEHVRQALDTIYALGGQLVGVNPKRLQQMSKLVGRLRTL